MLHLAYLRLRRTYALHSTLPHSGAGTPSSECTECLGSQRLPQGGAQRFIPENSYLSHCTSEHCCQAEAVSKTDCGRRTVCRWFSYLNFLRYGWSTLMINQFSGTGAIINGCPRRAHCLRLRLRLRRSRSRSRVSIVCMSCPARTRSAYWVAITL